MVLDKTYFEDKVKTSITENEKALHINNMLLFELLEYQKYIKPTIKEVVNSEPVVHANKGRKVAKG